MPIQILMPALSPTMTEGTLAKWLKAEGNIVDAGDVLCEIETDKATMEVEAVDEGTLGKILVAEGTEGVPVNQVIALLLEEGEDSSALESAKNTAPAPAAAPVPQSADEPAAEAATAPSATPVPVSAVGDRVFASPLAKRLAEQNALDITAITGSGPKGRVVKRDIEQALTRGAGKTALASASTPTQATIPAAAAMAPAFTLYKFL